MAAENDSAQNAVSTSCMHFATRVHFKRDLSKMCPQAPLPSDGTDAPAPAAPTSTERLVPRVGETLWVVRQEHLELILSGAKTLDVRPWRMRSRRQRWFLATRGVVCGKITVGEPFQMASAAMWAARASEHMEDPTGSLSRANHCWAYPLSQPLRLRPLLFRWAPDAAMWCRYQRAEAAAPRAPPVAPRAERDGDAIQVPRYGGRSVEVILPRRYGSTSLTPPFQRPAPLLLRERTHGATP